MILVSAGRGVMIYEGVREESGQMADEIRSQMTINSSV